MQVATWTLLTDPVRASLGCRLREATKKEKELCEIVHTNGMWPSWINHKTKSA